MHGAFSTGERVVWRQSRRRQQDLLGSTYPRQFAEAWDGEKSYPLSPGLFLLTCSTFTIMTDA
jgi:hypothetical protein